jgi:hypothetical protein
MAVYRYKWNGPNLAQLTNEVPGATTFSASEFYFVDVVQVIANKPDLDDAMLARGFSFTATDPVNTPSDEAATQGINKITVMEEGVALTKRGVLNFIGASVTAVDNSGAGRTDVTITAAGLSALAGANINASAGIVGTGTVGAREDHTHQVLTGVPVDITNANAVGTAATLARSDHTHNLPFAVVSALLAAASTALAFNAQRLTGVADPTAPQDAATKAYVDAQSQGIDTKASVRALATTNITLTGLQTIDGVSLIAGDRVLLTGQTTASQNGIYVVAAGAWARSADADTSAKVTSGLYTFVTEGTLNDNQGWILTTNDPIVLGTTALAFTQFTGAGSILAGNGINKTGNTLSVVAADASIVVGGTGVTVGVITDAQHGARGGGTLHALANGTTAGFMASADFTKLAALPAIPQSDDATFGANNLTTTATTRFLNPGGADGAAPIAPVQWIAPKAGTFRNFRVKHNVAGAAAINIVYTVRKNGTAQTPTVTVVANSTAVVADTVNSFTYAAGDLLDVQVTKAALTTSPAGIIATAELAP